MPSAPIFDRITIIGLGLIGSSIARAAREYHLAEKIVGCDANDVSLSYARSHKFIDVAMNDPAAACEKSHLVILATPPSTLGDVAKRIGKHLERGAIVMDTASVKQPAIDAISAGLPSYVDFIPAHPIAGSEQSGVAAGRADLFQKKRIIVTPAEPLQTEGLQRITSFWGGMGARVEGMPAPLHDLLYAHVSHLPQLLAFASGFSRLAQSSPALWAEIFVLNKDNIIKALDRYLDVVSYIEKELNQAPKDDPKPSGDFTAATLFPRLAASCLITTVMEAEKQAGFSFARFAGTGFADFTAPATDDPEKDIEQISNHYAMVTSTLKAFRERLQELRTLLANNRPQELERALAPK